MTTFLTVLGGLYLAYFGLVIVVGVIRSRAEYRAARKGPVEPVRGDKGSGAEPGPGDNGKPHGAGPWGSGGGTGGRQGCGLITVTGGSVMTATQLYMGVLEHYRARDYRRAEADAVSLRQRLWDGEPPPRNMHISVVEESLSQILTVCAIRIAETEDDVFAALVDRARNAAGEPLCPTFRQKLLAVLADPSEATWAEAWSVILTPYENMSLWHCVVAVRPGMAMLRKPGGYWDGFPDKDALVSAVRYGVS